MASRSDIEAGRAYVELYVKNSAPIKGLADAKKGLTDFGFGIATVGKWIAGIGAIITASILAATHTWATAGEEIFRMSQRTGMAVEKLSELKYAAAENGVAAESLEGGIRHMQMALSRLATPEVQAHVRALGLDLAQLRSQTPDEQFRTLADTIGRIGDPADRAGAACAIFGRHLGTESCPSCPAGGRDWTALAKEARDWGFVASKQSAEGEVQLAASFRRLETVTGGIWKTLGSALGPATREYTEILARNLRTVKEWLAANGDTVRVIFKWASAVVLGGTALYGLGKAFVWAGSAIGTFRDAVLWAAGSVDSLVKIGALVLSPFRQVASAILGMGVSLVTVQIPAVASRVAMLGFAAATTIARGAMLAASAVAAIAGAAWSAVPALLSMAWGAVLLVPGLLQAGFSAAALVAGAAWSLVPVRIAAALASTTAVRMATLGFSQGAGPDAGGGRSGHWPRPPGWA